MKIKWVNNICTPFNIAFTFKIFTICNNPTLFPYCFWYIRFTILFFFLFSAFDDFLVIVIYYKYIFYLYIYSPNFNKFSNITVTFKNISKTLSKYPVFPSTHCLENSITRFVSYIINAENINTTT